MRDAFGGAFSIKLMLIFLMLYIAFICVAINYARAFRVKNRIINMIEEKEGYNTSDATFLRKIEEYLDLSGYNIKAEETFRADGKSVSSCLSSEVTYTDFEEFVEPGYCIAKNRREDYYLVETYMVFSLPVINVNFPIAIRGETRVIEIP